MKIIPDDAPLESGICDLARMATIVQDLLIALPQRMDAAEVPDGFQTDLECVTFAASQLCDMTTALKAEFYADHKRKAKAGA